MGTPDRGLQVYEISWTCILPGIILTQQLPLFDVADFCGSRRTLLSCTPMAASLTTAGTMTGAATLKKVGGYRLFECILTRIVGRV